MGVRMKHHYSFHPRMESQVLESTWSNSPGSVNRNSNKIEVGKYHLKKYSIINGDNSLSPSEPVDSNPIGVN